MKERDRPLSREQRVSVELPMPKFSNSMTVTLDPRPKTTDTVHVDMTADDSSKKLLRIRVDMIDPNPLAPREVYTPRMILDRAEDLRAQGQHDPIHVIPNPDAPGRYIICDGWTRVQACQQHQVLDSLLAEVHDGLSVQESAWFGYQQNECRSQHCDLDRAMFYEKLIAAGESAAEIARKAKLSKTLMSFYRAYSKLPEEVLEVIRLQPEKFGANAAYQLFKAYEKLGLRKTLALANKYASEEQTVRWLSDQVQALLTPAIPQIKVPGKTIRYSNGVYKQQGDSFKLSITVSPEHRELFSEGLENLLKIAAKNDLLDKNNKNLATDEVRN